jgi:hypothetical protein
LLRVMQDTGHYILSPLKKGALPDTRSLLLQVWLLIYVVHYS